MAEKVRAHDPRGYAPKIVGKAMAPRLRGLDGKTIFLVDCRFDDSVLLLEQVRDWFAANMPSVTTKVIQLPSNYNHDDPAFWQSIKDNADAAIVGVGH
jgi:hypothetical protein